LSAVPFGFLGRWAVCSTIALPHTYTERLYKIH